MSLLLDLVWGEQMDEDGVAAGGAGSDRVGDPARYRLRHVPLWQPGVQLYQLIQVGGMHTVPAHSGGEECTLY